MLEVALGSGSEGRWMELIFEALQKAVACKQTSAPQQGCAPGTNPQEAAQDSQKCLENSPSSSNSPPPQLMGFMLEPLGNPGAEIPKSHPHYGMYWGEHRLRTECS